MKEDLDIRNIIYTNEFEEFKKERFSSWFERMLQYGFTENIDYQGCKLFNALANQELTDYAHKQF